MAMKILITGPAGSWAPSLFKSLAAGKTELGEIPRGMKTAQVAAAAHSELDIARAADVTAYAALHRPDVIINCAAYTDVDGAEENPAAAFRVNALGAKNGAEAAQAAGAKLVHISTDYIFFGRKNNALPEWDASGPKSVYGLSKLLGERYVREYCRRIRACRAHGWLYGFAGKNFVKSILSASRQKTVLAVVDDQRGSPTFAGDLAHHILTICASGEYGVYHCANRGVCSRYEFAREIVRLAGLACEITPCQTQDVPRPAPRPAYSALDNQMLRCTVGDGMRAWPDALASFMAHYDRESGEFAW
jgi:dTDP-4-dehydrorhamnose reductase